MRKLLRPLSLSPWNADVQQSTYGHSSSCKERTLETWEPRFLWIPEHSMQINAPRLRLDQSGSGKVKGQKISKLSPSKGILYATQSNYGSSFLKSQFGIPNEDANQFHFKQSTLTHQGLFTRVHPQSSKILQLPSFKTAFILSPPKSSMLQSPFILNPPKSSKTSRRIQVG